ncbi:MAG: sigma 54-interacting transcriptional regulator [Desulfosarcina sp.]|nr:sigma 54-interacting transcriptional regulator [Desulfobacterales bacterium]
MPNEDISRYWKRIINTMNDGLMLISAEGTILMVNKSFERLTGYRAEEVIGKSCTLLECDACEQELNNTSGEWCKLFQPHHPDMRRFRCGIVRKDGTCLSALKNASVLRDDQDNVLGAVETITDISEIDRLDQQVELLSRQLNDCREYQGIIGASPAIRNVIQVVEKAAQSQSPVIIFGESGTGKELVARAIHARGHRREGPYVQLNCAALNAALLESELFGHVKGAFTGAYRHRKGRFEAAHGGSIFLDEIGDIPLSVQIKLLRVLESKQIERVGDHRSVDVDVRIISATNQNLVTLIEQQQFREDLYFRINVIPIRIPPLRDRKDDIPLLVSSFIQRLQSRTGKSITGLTPEALQHFMDYSWPGNIRELKSVLEYAFVIAERGKIGIAHLPHPVAESPAANDGRRRTNGESPEKIALLDALRQTRGNQTQAARILGINRVTVWNRMRKYGIDLKKVVDA